MSFSKFFTLSLSILLLLACSEQKEPQFKIGVSQCSSDEWRDKMNREMQREMLYHDNSLLEIVSADDSNEKQQADIQNFVDRGFDIIIVAPNEAEALTPIIEKVYKAGIPVIIFDRRIIGEDYTSYIDLDNKGIGEAAAQYASSILNKDIMNNVVEITGLAGSTPAQERHEGFIQGLKEYPNLNLLAFADGSWDRAKASHLMDSMLNLYPDIKLVYAHSDNMALGVDEVLKERGRKDIKVLGTDASPGQGIDAVIDGSLDATFIYPTEGHTIIRTAFSILNGEEFDKTVHVPALTSVDKSNAEILLRQYDLLNNETEKVLMLDEKNDQLLYRFNTQTHLLRAVVTLAIVLGVIFILLLIIFIRNRKLQKELKEQNEKLIEERDKQIQLYRQLDTVLTKEDDFYSRFISHIKAEYSDPTLNTDKLAEKMNLGGAQLTRKIKAMAHFTPVEILRNYRLEKAKEMLLSTDKSINEITFAVGFSSAPYLTKCFREHFGMTPSELRSK